MVDGGHATDWLSSSKLSKGDGIKPSWMHRHKTGLGLTFAGIVAGGVLAGTLGASAATEGAGASATGYGPEGAHGAPPAGQEHGPRPPRGNEKPLSAALTASLKAKALAAVPGGTVNRVETGHGGAAYEAHVTKADGTKVRVTFDKNQKVLAVQTDTWKGPLGGPKNGGPRGGPGGHPGGGPEGGGTRPAGGPEGGFRGGPPPANPEG